MNTFKKHNIDHLSPSMINQFVEVPALTMLKIMGITDGEAGPSAWRGRAVEDSLTKLAFKQEDDLDTLVRSAERMFVDLKDNAEEDHNLDKISKERKDIEGFVKAGYQLYKNLGTPIDTQKRIELYTDEFSIPIIGYYDLLYEDCVRDIKTGNARSSVLSGHARQSSIYAYALKKTPFVDYVSKSKVSSFQVHTVERHIQEFIKIAKTLENILSISDDIVECCQFLPYPNIEHWMFGSTTRKAVMDIWQ